MFRCVRCLKRRLVARYTLAMFLWLLLRTVLVRVRHMTPARLWCWTFHARGYKKEIRFTPIGLHDAYYCPRCRVDR